VANAPVTVALTGASGTIYGLKLIESLVQQQIPVYLLISKAARLVLSMENDIKLPAGTDQTADYFSDYFSADPGLIRVFGQQQWTAPVASGSNPARAMVIAPCTTGTLSAVACGASNNLIERAADVMLKERRKLIMLVRETPLSEIHLENMLKLCRMGSVIMPADPGYYFKPQSIDDLVDFIVARLLDHLGVSHQLHQRWGELDLNQSND